MVVELWDKRAIQTIECYWCWEMNLFNSLIGLAGRSIFNLQCPHHSCTSSQVDARWHGVFVTQTINKLTHPNPYPGNHEPQRLNVCFFSSRKLELNVRVNRWSCLTCRDPPNAYHATVLKKDARDRLGDENGILWKQTRCFAHCQWPSLQR